MAIAQSLNDILYKDLPTKIKIRNKIYEINYDYRTILTILMAFEDINLYNQEKIEIMLKLLYKEPIQPEDYKEACEKACRFIDLGQKHGDEPSRQRIYSFTQDGSFILTGINSTHHIDISETPNMHWWKFMALFMDMGSECFFNELVYYRKRKIEGKLTKEEKTQYKKIRELVDLEQQPTEEMLALKEAREKFLREFNG